MSISFRAFDSGTEISAQRKLFQMCFPETMDQPSETREFYEWKFHSFPDPIPSYEFSAYTPEGELVGYYSAIPFSYKIGNSILRCGMVCDVMTSPSMRGKGVFTALGHYALQELTRVNVDFTLGYPVRSEVIPGHLKVGWKIAFSLPMYLFPIRFDHLLSSNNLSWAIPLGKVAAFLWSRFFSLLNLRTVGVTAQILTIKELLSLHDFNTFIEKWTEKTPNVLLKSSAFLQWRLSAPGADYSAVCIRDAQNRLSQIAIIRVTVLKGVPSLCILDWMQLENKRIYSRVCHREMTGIGIQRGCEVIVSMMSRNHARELGLRWLGYFPTPAMFRLIINNLRDKVPIEQLMTERNWALMWIDSDDL